MGMLGMVKSTIFVALVAAFAGCDGGENVAPVSVPSTSEASTAKIAPRVNRAQADQSLPPPPPPLPEDVAEEMKRREFLAHELDAVGKPLAKHQCLSPKDVDCEP
jgi:hypothetical protein